MKSESTITQTAKKPFKEIYESAVKGLREYTEGILNEGQKNIAGHLLKQIEYGSRLVLMTTRGKPLNANDIKPLLYLLGNYPVKELWLQYCAIEDKAMESLTKILQSQSSLEVLGITDTQVSNEGKKFLEGLVQKKNDIALKFKNTNIDNGMVQQQAEKLNTGQAVLTPNIIIHPAEMVEQTLEKSGSTGKNDSSHKLRVPENIKHAERTLKRRDFYKQTSAQSTIGLRTIGKSSGTSTATMINSLSQSEPAINNSSSRKRAESFDSPIKPDYVKKFSIFLPRHLSREICDNHKVYVGSELLTDCIREVVVNQYNAETKKQMVEDVKILACHIASHLQKELDPLGDPSKEPLDALDWKASKKMDKEMLQKLTEMPDYKEKVKLAVTAGIEQAGFKPELAKISISQFM